MVAAIVVVGFLVLLCRTLSIYLIYKGSKLGFYLFFGTAGISSSFLGSFSLGIGSIGSFTSLEWLSEIVVIGILLFFFRSYNIKKEWVNGLFLFFLLSFLINLFNVREINGYSMNAIFLSLHSVCFCIFSLLVIRNKRIKFSLNKAILISIIVSTIYGVMCHLLFGIELVTIYDSPLSRFIVDFRYRGSLGSSSYAIFLMPFAIYYLTKRRIIGFILVTGIIILTGSRAVTGALLILFLFDKLIIKGRLFNKISIIVFSSFVFLVIYILPIAIEYFETWNMGRSLLWEIAIKESFTNELDYLIGNGTGYSKYISHVIMPKILGTPSDLHSELIRVGVDHGIVIVLLLFIVIPFIYFFYNRNEFTSSVKKFIFFSFISIIVVAATDNILMYSFAIKIYIIILSYLIHDASQKLGYDLENSIRR